MVRRYNLALYRGDGFRRDLLFHNAAGEPVDLTGSTFAAQWRSDFDSEPAVDFTITPITGGIRVSLTGAETTDLASGVWDLEWRRAGDEPTTLIAGSVTLTDDVTHA